MKRQFRQKKYTSVKIYVTIFCILQVLIIPTFLIYSSLGQENSDFMFGSNIKVNDDRYSPYSNQVEPTMTILSSGRILVGWKEADTPAGGGRRVGFAYSIDNGTTFSRNILMTRLSQNNYQSDPWLISDANDNAYFVWIEYNFQDNPPEGIGVARTTDGGETWLTARNAGDTNNAFDDKETACIDSNGNIYIVWDRIAYNEQRVAVGWDLRFTKSTDQGNSFAPTTIMEMQPWIPYLHCSLNDTLYISTVNSSGTGDDDPIDQIHFIRSDDLGDTWTTPLLIPTGTPEIDIITVVDSDSDENVYIAYSAGTSNSKNIFVIKSEDKGVTWNIPVQVNDASSSTAYHRMVEMYIGSNDTLHVAWLDSRHGEYNIYYSYSDDSGDSFSMDERVSEVGFHFNFERPGDYFCMREDPVTGDMCIVWTDGRNGEDHDIYFARQGLYIPPPPPLWLRVVIVSSIVGISIIVLSIVAAVTKKRIG